MGIILRFLEDYIGIMENTVETTYYLGFRVDHSSTSYIPPTGILNWAVWTEAPATTSPTSNRNVVPNHMVSLQ